LKNFSNPKVTVKFFADDLQAYIIYTKINQYEHIASLTEFLNHVVLVTDNVRNLGLIVTPKLSWKLNIRLECHPKKWYNYTRALKTNDPFFLAKIYKIYIIPVLEYPSVVFNSYQNSTAHLIEKVKRRITRNIYFRDRNKLKTTREYPDR
jgi:hypothetical protein